ncbi:MAG: DUF115 domain-containing protein [Treponema sp.]|nr:DUF115 domain-containing protein [Treponema sp.]
MNKIHYVFSQSRSGEIVPALKLPGGYKPLHSMIDPKREAQRIVSETANEEFLICLGLGGGFIPQAILELTQSHVCVIDFDKESVNQLLANKNYSYLLKNERFTLLIDPSKDEIEAFILEHYKPALFGGIKTIPLRGRIEIDSELFDSVISSIKESIQIVSGDYSVQAHFGKSMFSNIIRNVKTLTGGQTFGLSQLSANNTEQAAIIAAGPSLDIQLPSIAELKQKGVFLISTDTAFPALDHYGIKPDVIVSLDCQHISFNHFASSQNASQKRFFPFDIPVIMDITSPPILSRFTSKPVYFCGGHPLARYISNTWKSLPLLDTSGANVTYACLSLADYLNVRHITLFGADFSYINSQSYARGTYIFPWFDKRQNRLSSLESLFSKFLFRTPFLPSENTNGTAYYETSTLRLYRKKLEEKAQLIHSQITSAKGPGAPICLPYKEQSTMKNEQSTSNILETKIGKDQKTSGIEFLAKYRNDILALPQAKENSNYLKQLNQKERQIFTTLLPCMAWLRKHQNELNQIEIIEETKRFCTKEIERVLCSCYI